VPGHGVDLAAIQSAEGFARISMLDDAVDALVGSEESKRRYLDLANTVERLYKAVLPDPEARAFAAEVRRYRSLPIKSAP
jgi:type I restriction enzyme, R subunit